MMHKPCCVAPPSLLNLPCERTQKNQGCHLPKCPGPSFIKMKFPLSKWFFHVTRWHITRQYNWLLANLTYKHIPVKSCFLYCSPQGSHTDNIVIWNILCVHLCSVSNLGVVFSIHSHHQGVKSNSALTVPWVVWGFQWDHLTRCNP